MTKVEFIVADGIDEYPLDAVEYDAPFPIFDKVDDFDIECFAYQFYRDHDGWKLDWPVDFEMFVDGKSRVEYG